MVRLHPGKRSHNVQSTGTGGAGARIYRQIRSFRCCIHGGDRRRVRIDGSNCVGRNPDFLLDASYGQANVDGSCWRAARTTSVMVHRSKPGADTSTEYRPAFASMN